MFSFDVFNRKRSTAYQHSKRGKIATPTTPVSPSVNRKYRWHMKAKRMHPIDRCDHLLAFPMAHNNPILPYKHSIDVSIDAQLGPTTKSNEDQISAKMGDKIAPFPPKGKLNNTDSPPHATNGSSC